MRENERRYEATARGRAKRALQNMRNRARRAGLECHLTVDDVMKLQSEPCWYCGAPATVRATVDRVDNALGYALDNVAPACNPCNGKKRASSLDEVIVARRRCEADARAWHLIEAGS